MPKAFVVFQEQKKREREASVFPRASNHDCFWYVSFSHLSFFLFVFYWLLLNAWLDHHHRVLLFYFSWSYDLSSLWLSSWFVGLDFHNFFFKNHNTCIGFFCDRFAITACIALNIPSLTRQCFFFLFASFFLWQWCRYNSSKKRAELWLWNYHDQRSWLLPALMFKKKY